MDYIRNEFFKEKVKPEYYFLKHLTLGIIVAILSKIYFEIK